MTNSTNVDHELAITIGKLHMNTKKKCKTELENQMDAIRAEEKRKDEEALAALKETAAAATTAATTATTAATAAQQEVEKKMNEMKRKYSSK
ncbi:unnamed protein product [Rotaria sp. Silwood2]|nr:unnamed protein product [Rotaria sp. Silwood2]CAF3306306.1 unnamed protein product [Rotaria sp. Silwood2]CAF3909567.1 unnamed protein product [Rotaria sp. Silwood2]CAF4234819.1 unnamed protein product [Rotaria sp. Silwood2]CAF4353314.1 unnamed protein product [Rotaria sp. Silwood2]